MERNVQLNWKSFVEAAIARRKELRMTQSRLSVIAGVSTPTVSRFENGSDKIELSSAFAILDSLGMLANVQFDHNENWVAKEDEHWVHERGAVGFTGYFRGRKLQCYVSEEAIEDNLVDHASREEMVRAVKRNRKVIHSAMNEKVQSSNFAEQNIVILTSRELSEALAGSRKASRDMAM